MSEAKLLRYSQHNRPHLIVELKRFFFAIDLSDGIVMEKNHDFEYAV